ncbi:amidase [Paenibacillus sp. y28]|uniref:amidase n=1 Tax=Paenibacillus sp. y28 TaxID=3129110 RepID=UPI00301819FD
MPDKYHAFVDPDLRVEPTGEGVLSGKTYAIKDVFHIQGYANAAGNPDWLRTHGPAGSNAEVINRLARAGAVLTGTTHTDELMYSLNGENIHYGTPVNPAAPDRIPGGSSSGSAVAVASGAVDFAIGTDTGGSVRVPSAYCGIYGFRPTHGVVSADGLIPLAPSFDTVGWMARTRRTMLDVGNVLWDETKLNPLEGVASFRKLFLAEDLWSLADEEAQQALLPLFEAFTAHGAAIRRVEPFLEQLPQWALTFRTLQGREIWQAHGKWILTEKPAFAPDIEHRFAWAGTIEDMVCEPMARKREQFREHMNQWLGSDGVLVIPTAPGIAPLRGQTGEALEHRRSRTMQLTCIAGLAGLPQATLPLAKVNGCPVGLSVIAAQGQDRKLLSWLAQLPLAD